MRLVKISLDPSDNVVLKGAFDELVKEVGREKFVDVGTGEIIREWLESTT